GDRINGHLGEQHIGAANKEIVHPVKAVAHRRIVGGCRAAHVVVLVVPADSPGRAGAQRRVLVIVIAEVGCGAISIGGVGRVVNLDHPAGATAGDRDPVVVASPVSDRRVHELGPVGVADLVDVVRGGGGGRIERARSNGIVI